MAADAFRVRTIGHAHGNEREGFYIELDRITAAGLQGLEGFSHVIVLWWAHLLPVAASSEITTIHKPYIGGPENMGVFATRSPARPTPINISIAAITHIDLAAGIVHLAWIDTVDGTPVVDIKPYHPSSDHPRTAHVPQWCNHWPKSIEGSSSFDWSTVFANH